MVHPFGGRVEVSSRLAASLVNEEGHAGVLHFRATKFSLNDTVHILQQAQLRGSKRAGSYNIWYYRNMTSNVLHMCYVYLHYC